MYIELPRGSQKPLKFKIKNRNGEHLKDTDFKEITMTCREMPDETSPILFQKKLTDKTIAFDSEEDKFICWIYVKDTKDLPYGIYGFDIKIEIGEIVDKRVGKLRITHEYTMED